MRPFTRHASSSHGVHWILKVESAARALGEQGIEVVRGDLDDRASLDRALNGVEGEQRQGIAFADAAKAAGIQHLVYSPVGSAERQTGIPTS